MKNSNPIDISTTCKLSIHPESFYWGKVAAQAVFELFWQLEIMVRWICIQVFSWGNNKEETKKRRPLHYLQVIQQQSILAWLWQLLSLLEFGIVAKLFFPFLKIQYNIIYIINLLFSKKILKMHFHKEIIAKLSQSASEFWTLTDFERSS